MPLFSKKRSIRSLKQERDELRKRDRINSRKKRIKDEIFERKYGKFIPKISKSTKSGKTRSSVVNFGMGLSRGLDDFAGIRSPSGGTGSPKKRSKPRRSKRRSNQSFTISFGKSGPSINQGRRSKRRKRRKKKRKFSSEDSGSPFEFPSI